MHFPTLEFALFFLLVLIAFWAVRTHRVARNALLLAASCAFYAGWKPALLLWILSTSTAAWLLGRVVTGSGSERVKRAAMIAGVGMFLGSLGWFKYYGFFRDNLEALAKAFGVSSGLPILEIAMPLGLSYVSFTGLAYLIDLRRGRGVSAGTLLDALVFFTFFPKVIIGPIIRSTDLMAQLHAPSPAGFPDLSRAVGLVASGLFKKVVLAGWLSTHVVEDIFNAPEGFSSAELFVGAWAYTIEIWADFSGYTDIAMGVALLLGFYLPNNFDQPYRATNISEFWRRWHMTFSNWLRDYVFLPLGGSRRGYVRTYVNLAVVMLVTGIWHGAGWKFIVWGGLHAVAIIAYKMVQDWRAAHGHAKGTLAFSWRYTALCWFATMNYVVLARIFFRSTDVEVALLYFRNLLDFSWQGQGLEWLVLPLIAIGLLLNFYGQHLRRGFERLHDATPPLARPLLWTLIAILVILLAPADISPAIYFGF
ncbi:MAG: MBOAT family protein [Myxococcales bacterium]|nr:MBOAT family protein [Myxococcales bacterium]